MATSPFIDWLLWLRHMAADRLEKNPDLRPLFKFFSMAVDDVLLLSGWHQARPGGREGGAWGKGMGDGGRARAGAGNGGKGKGCKGKGRHMRRLPCAA